MDPPADEEMPVSDGFRKCWEKALGMDGGDEEEEDPLHDDDKKPGQDPRIVGDWSAHYVDYAHFKRRLKYFARRRWQIREYLKQSPDDLLPETLLTEWLGPSRRMTTGAVSALPHHDAHPSQPLSTSLPSPGAPPNYYHYFDPRYHSPRSYAASSAMETGAGALTTSYVPFIEADSGSSDAESLASQHHHSPTISHRPWTASSLSSTATPTPPPPPPPPPSSTTRVKMRHKRGIMRRVSNAERNELTAFLTLELDKAYMFYLAQWPIMSGRVEQLTSSSSSRSASSSWPATQRNNNQADLVGEELLELMAFCVINIVTVHQILLRYDAFAWTFEGTPLHQYFLKQQPGVALRKLGHHEEVQAMADAYTAWITGGRAGPDEETTLEEETVGSAISLFQSQRAMFREILESIQANIDPSAIRTAPSSSLTHLAPDGTSFGELQHHYAVEALCSPSPPLSSPAGSWSTPTQRKRKALDHYLKTARQWVVAGLFEDRLDLEPAYISTMRGQSLTKEMQQLADWRQKRPALQRIEPVAEQKSLTGMQVYHLTLNLLSAFLYCMNYYIVEPSSTMYVNRLGARDAMSGTLIGMMPLAAFCSSIPYSMWTNRSFRHPFIMSACMLIMGNLVYSVADQFGVVWIALLGRFMSGLGAPKCIIRRYMADTTPMSLRTGVNAGFGMVVAAGSAMGPAMAIVLNQIEYTTPVPGLGLVTLNGLTLPGYFMACLWLTFLVIVLATFEEPDREGLMEQQNLEAKQRQQKAAAATPSAPFKEEAARPEATWSGGEVAEDHRHHQQQQDDDLLTIFSGESHEYHQHMPPPPPDYHHHHHRLDGRDSQLHPDMVVVDKSIPAFGGIPRLYSQVKSFLDLVTLPVRLCLGLLLCKVFTIEALVSATSALSKNRYHWQVQQVGTIGFINGMLVIPFSILLGRLSLQYQDHVLMRWLVGAGCFGMFLLIDLSDLVSSERGDYNKGHPLAVSPHRYIAGYFLSYISIQSFEGVIGSTLSKVIPTALASGTFNSGLLATLVDTSGRACGDLFISLVGSISIRQLMNLLFIPGFLIMMTCLVIIERYRDMLSV